MEPARFPFRAMGSPCELRLHAEDTSAIAEAAIAEVARLEAKYSRYREDSLLSRINRTAGDAAGLRVDAETAGLLDYAETAWRASEGRFDLTSGVLREAWDFRSGRLPGARDRGGAAAAGRLAARALAPSAAGADAPRHAAGPRRHREGVQPRTASPSCVGARARAAASLISAATWR